MQEALMLAKDCPRAQARGSRFEYSHSLKAAISAGISIAFITLTNAWTIDLGPLSSYIYQEPGVFGASGGQCRLWPRS